MGKGNEDWKRRVNLIFNFNLGRRERIRRVGKGEGGGGGRKRTGFNKMGKGSRMLLRGLLRSRFTGVIKRGYADVDDV